MGKITFTMAKRILKNLVGGPATLRYPFEPAKRYDASRGHIEINIDDCIFCGLCSKNCPADAIEVSKPDRTWEIDRFRCIICNSCVEACPKDCLSTSNVYKEPVLSGPVKDKVIGPEVVEEKKAPTEAE
ncbi:4Fe-4S dicluster domain-containing protein [Methanolacinia petrolearia]|uniref:4Fe-4S dicluster domain-containing protein n=1 Tax=Methanolacinia petrolearia TaxID=54120 RepID=UPI003BADA568